MNFVIIVGIVACVEKPAMRENYSPDKKMEGVRDFRTMRLIFCIELTPGA